MRILHAICSVNPTGGGPIEGVKQLSALAKLRGHHVEIVSLDSPDESFLKSFPLPVHALGPGLLRYRFSKHLVPWLIENSSNYDAIIVNGIWQYHSFGVWRALRRCSTPYVVFTHGMLDPWFKQAYPLKHLKKWLYWPWGEYRVLRDAAAVLFTCEEERILASRSFWMYKANEIVVNYGTTAPTGIDQTESPLFRDRFPETIGKRLILFMGRIHPKKGCDLAIEAFSRVLSSNPAWHLIIAGPDQVGWTSKLQSLALRLNLVDRITWAGMITDHLKWSALHASEVLILPSHQENFGIVVAEALACEVPILLSSKVNIWREIETDGAGLVEPDDLQGACCLLRRWAAMSQAQRAQMRVAARRCFERRFEARMASNSLLDVLTDLAGEKQALLEAR